MAAGHQDTFHHVRDFPFFELPETFGIGRPILDDHGHQIAFGFELPKLFGFPLTKFMVLQVVAALLALVIFRGLARRVRDGAPVRGAWWNLWETLVLVLRDDIVRPTIGVPHHPHDAHGDAHAAHDASRHHDAHAHGTLAYGHPADVHLPFVASCFFYILFCNLLGMIPWLGSPTGNISVTAALAATAFAVVIMNGSMAMGPVGFWKNQVPAMDVPWPLNYFLIPLVWLIEVAGLFIKHSVLAIRLFANIMAGHTVLGVLLGFIAAVAGTAMYVPVLVGSIGGQVFVSVLELLFALIQAYVFSFLTTVFISMAVHPH